MSTQILNQKKKNFSAENFYGNEPIINITINIKIIKSDFSRCIFYESINLEIK